MAVAVFGALFMVSGCRYMALSTAPGVLVPLVVPAPEPGPESLTVVQTSEPRVIGDIRGVALRPEAGGQVIEFSEVSNVRWTSSVLVITGTVDPPDSADPGQIATARYPVADIDYVIVRKYSKGMSSVRTFLGAAVIGFAGGYLTLLLASLAY